MSLNFEKNTPTISDNLHYNNHLSKKDILSNDLEIVSKKIQRVKTKIDEQKKLYEHASGIGDLKEKKITLSSSLKRSIIKQKLSTLEKKEKKLENIQKDLIQRMGAVQPDIQPSRRPFRRTLLDIIYPAVKLYSPEGLNAGNLISPQQMTAKEDVYVYRGGNIVIRTFESEIKDKKSKRIAIYTDDHHKLDGCIIYGNRREHNLKDKKMMVMTLGNAFTWQLGYLHAQLMAQKFDCNVLLYNPRGIGKSSGNTQYIQDAVVDCKAAISYALKNACLNESGKINPKNLGVYGHSLGGGVSAIALQDLINEGRINKNGIGLYINHHSFSSLSSFVKGLPKGGKYLGGLSRLVLSIAKHNRLRAKKAIKDTKLASRVVIATGEQDQLMGKLARLKETLRKEEAKGRPIANEVLYISIPDYGHHEEEEYLTDYDKMTKKSPLDEASFTEVAMNAEKLVQLQHYQQIIAEWAKS